jgi:hypothetical protein
MEQLGWQYTTVEWLPLLLGNQEIQLSPGYRLSQLKLFMVFFSPSRPVLR